VAPAQAALAVDNLGGNLGDTLGGILEDILEQDMDRRISDPT
jgi:hypothetical protein